MNTIYKLIGRGKVGWHADGLSGKDKCSSSGGTLEGYLKEAEDGCFVYDASEADYGKFASFVCSGPMADPTLAPGNVQRFSDHQAMAMMLPGLGGGFKTLAMKELIEHPSRGEKLGGMDYVACDVYISLLKAACPNVKTGKVVNHEIVWD